MSNEVAELLAGCVTREKLMHLQDTLVQTLLERGETQNIGNTDELCPVTHHFAPGLYAREMFIPAGTLIIGKIHRFAHVNTVSKGRIAVATEFGTQEIAAPASFVSQPGVKRAGVALEDTVWTTYHPTHETDLDRIEAEVIAPTYADYERGLTMNKTEVLE